MTSLRLLASACALLLPANVAQAATDWTKTVVATTDGGFRMGNPDAKVKLVEYASLTCPHCAKFHKDSRTALAAHVAKGSVSYEFRSFVLNGVDIAATLEAQCGGASKFFPMVQMLYATQRQWVGQLSKLSPAEQEAFGKLSVGDRLGKIADIAGFHKFALLYGIPQTQAKKCLADEAALKQVGSRAEAWQALGVRSTPAFFINGKRLEAKDWLGVEAEIKRAGG